MIAFRLLGGAPVYLYALLQGICAMLGLAWTAWQAPGDREASSRVDAGLVALLGSLLVGRAVYVGFHWQYYQTRLGELLLVSAGGFAWSGALLGGFLGLLLYSRLERKPLGVLADALMPLMMATALGAWIGGWIEGTGYGQAVSGWWGLPAPDEWGRMALRIPVQLMGVLLTLGIFWLVITQKGRFPGWRAALGTLGLCLELFTLSFLRADPAPLWVGLRLEAWIVLGLAGCCSLFLLMVPKFSKP